MQRVQTDPASLSAPTFFQLQEEERYRLARALMDGAGQILANSLVELDHSLSLIEANPQAAISGLVSLREEVRRGLMELRWFVAELQPPLLAELGLAPGLRHYLETFGERNGIAVELTGQDSLTERLPTVIETAVFRIVQEALANVLQHSRATHVHVQLSRMANQLQVAVEDNGRGFTAPRAPGTKRRQLGLAAMADRAALVGGHIQIFSEAGKGFRLVLLVPYHGPQEEPAPAQGGPHESRRERQNGPESSSAKKRSPTVA